MSCYVDKILIYHSNKGVYMLSITNRLRDLEGHPYEVCQVMQDSTSIRNANGMLSLVPNYVLADYYMPMQEPKEGESYEDSMDSYNIVRVLPNGSTHTSVSDQGLLYLPASFFYLKKLVKVGSGGCSAHTWADTGMRRTYCVNCEVIGQYNMGVAHAL